MLKLRGAARFAHQAIGFFPTRKPPGAKHLDRHNTAQLGIARAEDVPEGADAQFLEQLEPAQPPGAVGGRSQATGVSRSQQIGRHWFGGGCIDAARLP